MERLLAWIRSLGNAGAIENARVVLEQRRTDDLTLRALDRRVTAANPAA